MSSWNIHGSLVIFQNNFKTVDKFNRRLSMPHVTYLLCWLFRGDESHLNTNDVLRRTEFDDASVNKWTSRKLGATVLFFLERAVILVNRDFERTGFDINTKL